VHSSAGLNHWEGFGSFDNSDGTWFLYYRTCDSTVESNAMTCALCSALGLIRIPTAYDSNSIVADAGL
jgi:hypothetical protein